MTGRRPSARLAYAGLALADIALAATGRTRARRLTKPLLMPALLVGRDGPTRLALGLSGAGDVALLAPGRAAFTGGLGSFLLAHLAWVRALRARPGGGRLRRTPALAVPYLGAWVGLNAYLWRRTGPDRLPVLGYSAVLLAMALTALDGDEPLAAAGGGLFLVSDSLLALDRFGGVELPGHEGLVMATYTSAQALLAARGATAGT